MAKDAKQTISWGQRVRSIEIQADAGRGMGVWEELHLLGVSPADFADRLRDAALEYHGVVGDVFLKALVNAVATKPKWVADFLNSRKQKYLHAVGESGWDAAQARIAARFALVYAAGSLAYKFGILPWDWKARLWAVKSCHQRVIAPAEVQTSHIAENSIGVVRSYITANLDRFIDLSSNNTPMTKKTFDDSYGISYNGKSGNLEYLIANERFRNAVCGSLPPDRVVADLSAAGLMNRQQGGKWSVTRDFPEPLKRARAISIKHKILKETD
jgi:hypothetical protein